jgi:tetratricopeptide (TPR) repeat protein
LALPGVCLTLIKTTHPYWPFCLWALIEVCLLANPDNRKQESLKLHALLLLTAYTTYIGLQPTTVFTAFHVPSGDKADSLPFGGETMADAVADSTRLIQQQAKGNLSDPPPCFAPPSAQTGCSSPGDQPDIWAILPDRQKVAIKSEDNEEVLEVDGISMKAVEALVHQVFHTEVSISGDVVLEANGQFRLEARSSSGGGPWRIDPKPSTEDGLRSAACALAAKIMESSQQEVDVLAAAFVNSGNFTKAIDIYRRHPPSDLPNHAEAYALQASAFMGLHQDGAAATALGNLLRQKLSKSDTLRVAGTMYLLQNKLKQSIDEFEQWKKQSPNDSKPLQALGLAEYEAKDYDDAIKDLKAASALDSGNRSLINALGLVYAVEGDHQSAIVAYTKSIQLLSTADAYRYRGYQYYVVGNLPQAIADYRMAAELEPKCAAIQVLLGTALYGQGKLDPAISAFKAATGLDPSLVSAHSALGAALTKNGQYEEAIPELVKGGALSPGNLDGAGVLSQARDGLGSEFYKRGELSKAETEFRESSKLTPKLASPHQKLAIALIQDGTSLAKALPADWQEVLTKCNDALSESTLFLANASTQEEQAKAYELRGQGHALRLVAYIQLKLNDKVGAEVSNAVRDLQHALQLDPSLSGAKTRLETLENAINKPSSSDQK